MKMASINVSDYSGNRKHAFNIPGAGYTLPGGYGQHAASQASALRAAPYLSAGNPLVQTGHTDPASIAALAQGFGAMNLTGNFAASRGSGSHMSPTGTDYSVNGYANQPGMFMAQQPFLFMPSTSGNSASANMYTSVPSHMHSSGFSNSTDNSPHGQSWTPRIPSDGSSGPGMPALITPRRGSISSNEEHVPATPFTVQGNYNNGVAVLDRSPTAMYGQSGTPSPLQFIQPFSPMHQKFPLTVTTPVHIQMLVAQDPPIPRAIPAPSSPIKPLDRCLENKNGETNVYIRGLLPETTDEMLHVWGLRFGDIQSSKSIIDLKTGLCKGFGFIKYHNFDDAESCIRGFHFLGYEVSFARESFYAKLKKFSDESNTNLYVSNIPRNMNEHELSQCFAPYKVLSSRILRDDSGNGRGVGFARFESREICEEVMKKFNNTPVSKNGGEEHVIQIRYSDTHEQKMLKQQTAAARQFRAAEFEYGCLQTGRHGPGLLSMPDRVSSTSPAHTTSPSASDAAPTFEQYLHRAAAPYVAPALNGRQAANFPNSRSPLSAIPPEAASGRQTPRVSLPASEVKNEGGVALDGEESKPRPASVHSTRSSQTGNADVAATNAADHK
ncbi:uncharacterized protein PV09_08750 [Verruconis gallopava]|uniref:RRM domain-containing protein n=1 Tax=Verruconis gallopava TaxID=253628 RepID=A0A0D1ZYT1_9PEZI|nr:uncharacterized protein PV09_08750 [Verruconis gallopava]KIV99572.1 hypothetical protein PV09_08750 [Verruconis gallopava]